MRLPDPLTLLSSSSIITTMPDHEKNQFSHLRQLIKTFPKTPGVYLMKDDDGVVLYIGKAKSLRDRAGSYFQPASDLMNSRGPKIVDMVGKVCDITYLECDSDVEAILNESRLIKDIQPIYNTRQTDGKSFPYLEITSGDDFPLISMTRQPQSKGSKLYGPFSSAGDLRRVIQVLQRVFKFRTCTLEINADDEKLKYFRPCLLHDIDQCTAPCAAMISKEAYRQDISRLRRFLESKRSVVMRQLQQEMQAFSQNQQYEEAARLRDEIKALESLDDRGDVDEHVQPELFQINPTEGLEKLGALLNLSNPVRVVEGIDIAHIQGQETVGSLVCFIDGRPFKKGYRRFRIKEVSGIDDYASIREVIRRRYRRAGTSEELYPDVILIDGGLGQLHAALEAFENMAVQPPRVISLAKKEELIYLQKKKEPLRLARHHPTLRLLQYVRDEAHRFAQHYFHILRDRKTYTR
jgi:excinuclease ABC subunit C